MNPELPAQSIIAIATLVASLITAAVSFVNLTLTKELKTSEFRQTWIDGLRQDLAQFFGAARAFARAVEELKAHGANGPLRIREEKVSDLRYQAAETFSKIRLRLNSKETEHEELLRLLKRAIDEQNEMLAQATSTEKTLKAIDLANEYARSVLKKEWERVKRGELAFRIARNWLAPIIFVLSIAFVIFVWTGAFKI
jgi:hypothetical protein